MCVCVCVCVCAVSYTHLDVYKRQDVPHSPSGVRLLKGYAPACASLGFLRSSLLLEGAMSLPFVPGLDLSMILALSIFPIVLTLPLQNKKKNSKKK